MAESSNMTGRKGADLGYTHKDKIKIEYVDLPPRLLPDKNFVFTVDMEVTCDQDKIDSKIHMHSCGELIALGCQFSQMGFNQHLFWSCKPTL